MEVFNEMQTDEPIFTKSADGGCRSSVPEDVTNFLYLEMFNRLAHIPSSRRSAVIRALAAIYEISL